MRRENSNDGYDLWLGYRRVEDKALSDHYRQALRHVVFAGESPVLQSARDELLMGLSALLGCEIPVCAAMQGDGAIVAGTTGSEPLIAGLVSARELAGFGTGTRQGDVRGLGQAGRESAGGHASTRA